MKYHLSSPLELFSKISVSPMILSGNEAYTRGLYEAGTQFVSNYPGTPTSEIGDLWKIYANETPNVFYDLAVNETVAFEAAVGASWSGIRSAVIFKHLGMNLIADALHSVMYSGIRENERAGLVIICGGDPDIISSTNAMDVRLFSFHSKLPILEPSSIQECIDFVKLAFELSEKIGLPVMLYAPSALHHAYSKVNFVNQDIPLKESHERSFQKNFDKYLNAIHWAKRNQTKLNSKIFQLEQGYIELESEFSLFSISGNKSEVISKITIIDNSIDDTMDDENTNLDDENEKDIQEEQEDEEDEFSEQEIGELLKNLNQNSNSNENNKNETIHFEREPVLIGFITSGVSYCYVQDFSRLLQNDFPCLRFIQTFPLNREVLISFIEDFEPEILIILEEQESFLETQIKQILYDYNIFIPIIGKNSFSALGSLSSDAILQVLGNPIYLEGNLTFFEEIKNHSKTLPPFIEHIKKDIPIREPTFCPGCSHRNVFYALRKAAEKYEKKSGKQAVYGGDIGCYTLGMSKPYEIMDWLICMGAGVGIMNGVAQVSNNESQHFIAIIGDSTFFHSGIPPILNLIKNQTNVLILILDNYYTAMTGHQPSPSTPINIISTMNSTRNYGVIQTSTSIKKIIQSLGDYPLVEYDGYSLDSMKEKFFKQFQTPGVKFALVSAECALNAKRRLSNTLPETKSKTFPYIADHCTQCNECYQVLGCTAIQNENNQYYIDSDKCIGENCLSCIEVCPNHAIYKTIINPHLDFKQKTSKKEGE